MEVAHQVLGLGLGLGLRLGLGLGLGFGSGLGFGAGLDHCRNEGGADRHVGGLDLMGWWPEY